MDYQPYCHPGQTSRTLAIRIKENRSVLRNCNLKASLMASHCVDHGHIFDLAETQLLRHASSWAARLFKEAWLTNKNSMKKYIELPQAYSVLRVAIEIQSILTVWGEMNVIYSGTFCKILSFFGRRFIVLVWKPDVLLTTKSPCLPSHSGNYSQGETFAKHMKA